MTDNLSLDGAHYTESATAKAAEGMRVPVMEVIIDDLKRENEELKHDITRHLKIIAELLNKKLANGN